MMKQEIKVNVTLNLEGEAGCNRYEVSQFVRTMIPGDFEADGFALIGHQIHRISEEGDIYSLPRPSDRAVWEFV